MKSNRVIIIIECITSAILRTMNQTCQPKNNDDIVYKQESLILSEPVARFYSQAFYLQKISGFSLGFSIPLATVCHKSYKAKHTIL